MPAELKDLLSDDDPSITLTGLLTSAVHDQEPPYTLEGILETLRNSDLACHLDPLNSLSILLPCPDPAVDSLLDLMSAECSAKEIIIASEENLERLHRAAVLDEEDEAEDDEEGPPKDLAISAQVLRLVRLFSVIIKVPFRRKSAAEMIKPFIPELQSTIRITGGKFSKESGRETILHSARLVDRILEWTQNKDGVTKEEIDACKDILVPFVESVVDSLVHCIHASLAKRAFKQCFPRLGLRENLDSGWEENAEAVNAAISSHSRAGDLLELLYNREAPLLTSPEPSYSEKNFSLLLPIVIASIQANTLLDESLSFLLLHLSQTHTLGRELEPETVIPLCTILPGLASAHPDAFIRHCTFRVLGLVLTVAPVPLRMQILQDLASDKSMPQMRVAVIGLRELRSLQTYPPDLFADSKKPLTVKEIEESTSCFGLRSVLALYFVVEMRDVKNRTGIRDRDNQANIERYSSCSDASSSSKVDRGSRAGGTEPLRANAAHLHSHAVIPLVSLKMGLERIDEQRKSL
ncbi:hypothetical protein BT96DRAFT_1023104 [Gymnopus androsaceus JB14]|uniref:Uncharacterized protein n=1 Tax=Gymnopus androsaceus JB14 TaxID=1447944 RepID=A0A6A4H7C0_9AGAR|nr:hypothetical protein BT96DRAFT_1023104 [Gymnopus androsaceus JB14]